MSIAHHLQPGLLIKDFSVRTAALKFAAQIEQITFIKSNQRIDAGHIPVLKGL
jgi:hypothetical protein